MSFRVWGVALLMGINGFSIELGLWTNSNETETCQIEWLFTPTTREELIALVQEARVLGKGIKLIGAGHSLNAIAVPEEGGWVISLEKYARVVEVDAVHRTVTAQGGATLERINEALAERGLALENLGSISEQTVGGVIQTGTHGTGRNYGPLHTQVVEMTVINGKGECKTIGPEEELFRAHQCGLGALGIVDTITLRAVPAQLFHERTYAAQWPDLLDQVEDLVQEHERFRFYWFPYANCAGVWTAGSADSGAEVVMGSPKDDSPLARLIGEYSARSVEDVLELGPTDPVIVERFNRAFFEVDYEKASERIDRSDRIFNVDCGAHSHCCAVEACFPIRYTKSLLLKLQALIEENHFPAHVAAEVRFVKADQALISPTYSENVEDLFCFVSILSIRPNLSPVAYRPYFQAFQKLVEECGGRLHWGKMGTFDPAYLRKVYPQWELFRKLQAEEDPDGVFLNAFSRHILER